MEDYFIKISQQSIIVQLGAPILSPSNMQVSIPATLCLMSCKGMLNPHLYVETDDIWTYILPTHVGFGKLVDRDK